MRDDRCAEKKLRVVRIKEQKYLDAIQKKESKQISSVWSNSQRLIWSGSSWKQQGQFGIKP